MASQSTHDYYKNLKDVSTIRAMAETIMVNPKVKKVNTAEAYKMALSQPGVSETDLEIYPPKAKELGLPKGAKVINDCHGKIIGRTAQARVFYNRIPEEEKRKVEGDVREAIYQMEKHIPGTDILVNGINWPMEKRGKVFLITKEMLALFKPGAVICDLISNPPGQSPIQTMHPTSLEHISYVVDGVIHTSCWAWPGLNPKEVSRRYSLQVAPILLAIADNGIDNIPEYIKKAVVKFV